MLNGILNRRPAVALPAAFAGLVALLAIALTFPPPNFSAVRQPDGYGQHRQVG